MVSIARITVAGIAMALAGCVGRDGKDPTRWEDLFVAVDSMTISDSVAMTLTGRRFGAALGDRGSPGSESRCRAAVSFGGCRLPDGAFLKPARGASCIVAPERHRQAPEAAQQVDQ